MKQKTRDNLIYLAVAGLIVGVLTFYIFYNDASLGRIPEIPGPILWGVLSTPAIIGLILERFWEYRYCRSLWLTVIATAVANGSTIFIAYSFNWKPPVLVWAALTLIFLTAGLVISKKVVVQ
jgi:hypothetical protein